MIRWVLFFFLMMAVPASAGWWSSSPGSSTGGSSLTVTDGTHSVTSTTTITTGNGLVVGGSAGSATLASFIADTLHTTTGTTANIGGQDDYSGSSLTATLAALTTGQSLLVTDQNSTALTLALGGQTVVGLPVPTSLNNGGFYAFTYNSAGTLSGYGFPGYGTITSGALVKFNGANGSFTAGDLSGDCTTAGALVITCTKINGDANIAFLDVAQSFTKPQRTNSTTPAISTATFTPVFSSSQDFRVVLVHASCPCTLANPAALVAGQSGMFEIVQSATGSDTIGTWGSEFQYVGGTSAITLSTGANAVDYIPYRVDSTGNFIVLGGIIKGPAH